VFDFFSKLTNSSGYLLPQYAVGPNDPHPNAAATALVAPLLVNEVFDHSIAYELVFGIIKLGNAVPLEYSLEQNYPNPFNPETTIEFSVPSSGKIKLSLFDVLGNEVIIIINEHLPRGKYSVKAAYSSLASGVYIYVLRTSGLSITKKMILVK
jgi:hypothetical protein